MLKAFLRKFFALWGLHVQGAAQVSMVQRLFAVVGLHVEKLPPDVLRIGSFDIKEAGFPLRKAYHTSPGYNQNMGRAVELLRKAGEVALIDIGANCGDTLAIAKTASADCEVLCIEGDDELFAALSRNARQFSGVTIQQCYLGETSSRIQVAIRHRGSNNTLANADDGEAVEIRQLDEVVQGWSGLPRLRFIKCDTEGYDIRILMGAKNTLLAHQPVILFEYNRDAMRHSGEEGFRIFPYLAGLGYHDLLIYNEHGTFLLEADLQRTDLLKDLHDMLGGSVSSFFYFDVIAFAKKDTALAAEMLVRERQYRNSAAKA